MLLEVVTYPDSSLDTVCDAVCPEALGSDEIGDVIHNMIDTMMDEGGIGLAANQVGLFDRIIVIRFHDGQARPENKTLGMVNPVIVQRNKKWIPSREGCLSVPGKIVIKKRSKNVTVEWFDADGKEHHKKFVGMDAICIQHEIDHLDGILILDGADKIVDRKGYAGAL